MKIIHTADLHLDSKMESNLSTEQATERRGELLDTFSRMVSYAEDNGVSVILISGDLFDKPHIRKRARTRVVDEIVSHPDIDFLYLKGNHDHSDLLSDDKCPDNLKLFDSATWTSYSYGDVVITGRELDDDNYKTLPVNLILDESKINIVTLHGQESDYVGKDRTHIITIPEFKNKYIDYLALGHIHSYKMGELDDRGIFCYPGCLEGRGFDECGEKGFVLLDIDERFKVVSPIFVPFAKRRLHELHVEVTKDMNMPKVIDAVKHELSGKPKADLFKVILEGETEMDFDLDVERIVHIFSEEVYFIKVYDETRVIINYEDFALDRSLKGEFVRMMQNEDMLPDERLAIVEMGMKALLGEEL